MRSENSTFEKSKMSGHCKHFNWTRLYLEYISENEIIRGEPGMPIIMNTKFGYILSRPVAKVQNLSNLRWDICSAGSFYNIPYLYDHILT